MAPYLPACQPAHKRCASTGSFPLWAWCVHHQPSNSTRHETGPVPSPPVLSCPASVLHRGPSPPCCRASIRRPLGLGRGLVAHLKRQSKLLHSSRNTTACFRSLRPGPSAKGDAAPIPAPAPDALSTSQHPSNPAVPPGPFFETAAVGWLTGWMVQSCFCLSCGLKLVGG